MNYHLPVRMVRAATAVALLASITVTALCASAHQASADSYPSRRITFVVPYPAGGATDVLARLLANKLQESWKQTVLVENKSGGGGVVGNDYVAKAQPDGHTVLVGITQIIQAPSLVAKLPYDVFKDLAPVTQISLSTIVLVVPEQQPIKSVKELVDYAKANPGKPYGTFGNATTSHLYGELLKKVADVDMTHVPYRGSAPLTNDLLANTVNSAFVDLTTASGVVAKPGAVNARFPVSLKSMTVRSTVKFPVNDAACTTATETSGGCPVLPDWTETPDRLVTRSE